MWRRRRRATPKWPSALPRIGRGADRTGRPSKRRDLPVALRTSQGRPVLVDCLTLWLSNLLLADDNIDEETALLEQALAASSAPVVLVANEVGYGIVPEHPLGRRF